MNNSLVAKVKFALLCAGVLILSFKVCSAQELRVWTSANGQHTFEAELLSQDGEQLQLRGKDGKVRNLKVDQLSTDDRDYLEQVASIPETEKSNVSKQLKDRLKQIGLRLLSDELGFLDERKLKTAISDLLRSRKKLASLQMKLDRLKLGPINTLGKVELLKQERVTLNAQLANASSVQQNSKIVALLKANIKASGLLLIEVGAMNARVQKSQSILNQNLDKFLESLQEARQLSDSLDVQVATLKKSDEFISVVAAVEDSLGRKMKAFGETDSLSKLRAELATLEERVRWETIKLNADGKRDFTASVSIDGGKEIEMVIDPGKTVVALPRKIAAQLNVQVGPSARLVSLPTADGRTFAGRMVILNSVKLGDFTARSVDCVVLSDESGEAPILLGRSFLRNFRFKLDSDKGEMKVAVITTKE